MSSLSSRSRRALSSAPSVDSALDDADDGASSCVRSNRWLALLTMVLLGACGYLVATWRPVDYYNIGHVRADEFLSYGPIDVVYTWVNGTDPRWKREKEYWHKHWIASLTGQPLPKKPEDTQHVKGTDVANADNRFRDNEELRYSLRSLEKYAPWIRNIYVVTDGQVPSWLNLEAPNLRIVKHSEIFANQTHLPVFSSPAIEWNLDNIPGLSDHFLYFNDDVFLGAKVHPEDFVSQRGVQKVYFAWEVPLCSAGCWDTWLANDRCDPQCNVTACDFDMGDCGCDVSLEGHVSCDLAKIASIQEAQPKPPKLQDTICQGGCHYAWIGDKGCDVSCNNTICGFDGGDCGGTEHFDRQLHLARVGANHSLVQVAFGVNSTYLNLTDFFGVNGSVATATHDNAELIRHATVFEEELSLLLVFGRDAEGDAMTSSALVSVLGRDVDANELRLDFELVRGAKPIASGSETATTGAGFATFTNTSIRPKQVRLPLAFRQSEWTAVDTPVEPVKVKAQTAQNPPEVEPHLEILLPVNVTGKQFQVGDVVTLAVDSRLRLHNDDGDDDLTWLDFQTCELVVPETETKTKEDAVATLAVDASTGEAASVAEAEAPTAQVATAADDASAKCRVVDDGRILITLRVPTHANVHEFKEETSADSEHSGPAPSRGDVDENADADDGAASEADSAAESALEEEEEEADQPKTEAGEAKAQAVAGKTPNRAQVADGHVCFSNLDNKEKQYCFAVSLGHFQPKRVTVALKPKPVLSPTQKKRAERLQAVEYEPYDGVENPAWQEFVHHCMDTTRRVVGLRPRKCYASEVPAIVEQIDPKIQNAEDGRRLACEAKRRRLNEMEERLEQERLAQNRGGFRLLLADLVASTVDRVKSLVGADTLEPTMEDIEDVEYEDVCKPLFEADREAAAQEISAANAEALLSKDTFGDSLKFVNRLYNRAFGKAPSRRRVPSHMPFLLDRQIIREIKARWPSETAATSAHRFRHPQDMQFSFAYFHYLLNRHKVVPPSLEFIWREYLDANRNGILDENEVLTVASLAHGDYPPDAFVSEVRECLRPPKQGKVMEKSTAKGTVLVSETLTPHITLDHLKSCVNISASLVHNVRREKRFELMPEDEVTFHMLSDQYRYAWNQMLGTRARRTKFVCINDDMKFPSSSVAQILHELFLSIWPKRSQFELPYHLKNRYDHIDDYEAAKDRRDMYLYVALTIVLLLVAVFWSELRKLFGFQDIARARAESASQLSAQLELDGGGTNQSSGGGYDARKEDEAERKFRQQQLQAQAVRAARDERRRDEQAATAMKQRKEQQQQLKTQQEQQKEHEKVQQQQRHAQPVAAPEQERPSQHEEERQTTVL